MSRLPVPASGPRPPSGGARALPAGALRAGALRRGVFSFLAVISGLVLSGCGAYEALHAQN